MHRKHTHTHPQTDFEMDGMRAKFDHAAFAKEHGLKLCSGTFFYSEPESQAA